MTNTHHAAKAGVTFPSVYGRRQLNALYRNIPLKDTTFRLLRKYLCAAANLYGIVTLKKVYEIFMTQNPGLITKEQFIAFSEIAQHEDEDYVILSEDDIYHNGVYTPPLLRELVDRTLFIPNITDYLRQKNRQQNKPYYTPKKQVFLQYADPMYFEQTEEYALLEQFLRSNFGIGTEANAAAFWDILYGVRYTGAALSDVLTYLNGHGHIFTSRKAGEKFCKLYMNFHNNTRMQCHRGHTPNEIHLLFPQNDKMPRSGPQPTKSILPLQDPVSIPDLRIPAFGVDVQSNPKQQQIFSETKVLVTKPGRNDLCPCGSGRKYKRCCGRTNG